MLNWSPCLQIGLTVLMHTALSLCPVRVTLLCASLYALSCTRLAPDLQEHLPPCDLRIPAQPHAHNHPILPMRAASRHRVAHPALPYALLPGRCGQELGSQGPQHTLLQASFDSVSQGWALSSTDWTLAASSLTQC